MLLLPTLLLFAIWLALSTAGAIGWLGGTLFFGVVAFGSRINSPPHCLDKETPCKGWDILGNGVIINVFLHFSKEL
jgi:hypothetical protein